MVIAKLNDAASLIAQASDILREVEFDTAEDTQLFQLRVDGLNSMLAHIQALGDILKKRN